jgi:hypothetical protein
MQLTRTTVAWAALAIGAVALFLTGVSRMVAPDPDPTPLAGTLVLMRSGGYFGSDDRLVVFPDGRWFVVRQGWEPAQGTLPDGERQKLVRALDRADLPHRHPRRNYRDGCCDLSFYTFAYRGSDYATSDLFIPPVVRDVLDLVNPLLDAAHTKVSSGS